MTSLGLVLAKDLKVGDKILTLGRETLDTDENAQFSLKSTQNISTTEVEVLSTKLDIKKVIHFNSNEAAKYSIKQPIFIFRDEELKIVTSEEVIVGDMLLEVDIENKKVNTTPVTKISVSENDEDVVDIRTSDSKTFIAGLNLVIS
jgi:intein/homing endonuclease